MASIQFRFSATFCVALALTSTAFGQTATHTLNLSGGSGFSGTLGGSITADVLNSSSAVLNVTDLDIRTVRGSNPFPFTNFFPNSSSNNNTATIPIAIAPSQIAINIPSTPFSSPITGSMDVTAGDTLANEVVGVLDGGVPGSDGKWDDPQGTGILNNASASNIQTALTNPINAPATVSGGVFASIPNNVTIPNVVNSGIIAADLVVKNTSNLSVNFSPNQNISLQGLTIGASVPIDLTTPGVGNFVDGAHPVPGAAATLDLSAGGSNLVSTTISGTLVSDIVGTINGSIDLAAVIRLDFNVFSFTAGTFNLDNVIDGELSDGVVSLIDLNEAISIDDVALPFSIEVIHQANTDVDFDAISASLASGTLGLTLPFSLSEQGISIPLPATDFELAGQSFAVNESGQRGTVFLDHLAGTIGGNLNLDLTADLTLQADMLATAFENAAINVVPEPASVTLMAFAALGLIGYGARRRRK